MKQNYQLHQHSKLRQEKSPKGHSCGNHHHGGFDSYIDGLCADIRATGGIWLVWLGIPNHIVCSVFHITAVYIRCGCCSGGACRSSSAWHGNRGRKQRGHDGCTGVYIFVALWLLAFYFMNAGKLVNYISAPVMGGFITGICTTIILMQAPKLMGSAAGTGELLNCLSIYGRPYTT